MDTKHIRIADFNYDLPDDKIAEHPNPQRDHAKLLLYQHGVVSEDIFYHITRYLPEGALMVFNNTRVIQARMHFRKETGALIEIFLMEPAVPSDYERMFQTTGHCSWLCMVGNMKKWKEGSLVRDFEIKGHQFSLKATMLRGDELNAEQKKMTDHTGGTNYWINFDWDADQVNFADILEQVGELPIPPYLNRSTEESDKIDYQTVYSKINGSVAAPTAGLHFTDQVLKDIDLKGIVRDEVTLHVGAGTFKPVKTEEIEGHEMHSEYIVVHRHTFERLLEHHCGCIAVGTTSVRTLESLYYMGAYLQTHPDASEEDLHVNQWDPYDNGRDGGLAEGITPEQAVRNILAYLDRNGLDALHSSTALFIAPGYTYKFVKLLVTNFHQPESTLLLLVSAFLHGDWKKVYRYALTHDFKFLSYGDACLLIP
ncbi:MAG: S-adenosylmethionine:tRNA ribosyltransferase-isomerase [Prevotella sp.]|jgi:S-adenosylmethionine:tRNA ribosyltransferase-isomerase|nr:S-adenosylmethionine:tRNA ribosyltransferase-isomerase [Prevotella sp.]MCH3985622.1 S-adenosylmethionine:tRNA ribosyltransferase-isomerase [Prevotella sp.]MCH3993157.1 S-adenosylmethionine:tRNA ribosyltransferase-isomerase [Prevotella sp.]MCH4017994.1 S-adenosylmethionine:tRNA ribosyltransferase-isomerase [Prevotella sp.]MCH4100811.1 S-adenosylmethionine:tRNA ribosyltransferase-isomerase [Prevotella sp.]